MKPNVVTFNPRNVVLERRNGAGVKVGAEAVPSGLPRRRPMVSGCYGLRRDDSWTVIEIDLSNEGGEVMYIGSSGTFALNEIAGLEIYGPIQFPSDRFVVGSND